MIQGEAGEEIDLVNWIGGSCIRIKDADGMLRQFIKLRTNRARLLAKWLLEHCREEDKDEPE